jgi:hypothetical protein
MSDLKHTPDRVIVACDLENKNSYRFKDGTIIRLERQYNNLNRRETEPVNCLVVSAEDIPEGAEMLVSHNAFHPTNQIFNYKPLSGKDIASDIKFFSLSIGSCYAWRNGDKWQPLINFDFALRIFKPYSGVLQGIEPTILKDSLYVTTGELKGKAVKTVKASDYCIIFQDVDGRENQLIRFRPFGNEKEQREPEAIAVLNAVTEQIEKGELLVGISVSDAKTLKEMQHAG